METDLRPCHGYVKYNIAYRERRPQERDEHIHYLVDRLLVGEAVAHSALEHYGLKVTIREALAPEILP